MKNIVIFLAAMAMAACVSDEGFDHDSVVDVPVTHRLVKVVNAYSAEEALYVSGESVKVATATFVVATDDTIEVFAGGEVYTVPVDGVGAKDVLVLRYTTSEPTLFWDVVNSSNIDELCNVVEKFEDGWAYEPICGNRWR